MRINSMKGKLIILCLLIVLVPIIIIGYSSYNNFKKAQEEEIYSKLVLTAKLAGEQLESYFTERFEDLNVLAQMPLVISWLEELEQGLAVSGKDLSGFIASQEYLDISSRMDPWLRLFMEGYGYYDVFLIGHEGNVLFTVEHEADFGTNLLQGQFKGSNLGRAVSEILIGQKQFVFTDFEPYVPSNNAPAAFIVQAISSERKKIHGVVALQISNKAVYNMVLGHSGLGESGEIVIARKDAEGNALFLTPLRFDKEAVLKRKVPHNRLDVPIIQALKQNINFFEDTVDYRDVPVLSATQYVANTGWGLVVKEDRQEAFAPIEKLRREVLIISIVITIIVIVIAVFIATRMVRPLKQLSSVAEEVATGDLTKSISVKTGDEIGALARSFRTMVEGLGRTVTKIKDAVSQMGSASREILAASQQQAASAREQSSAVSETTAAAMEMAKSAEEVGVNIKKVAQAANHALVGMARIKDAINKTGGIVTSLSEKSQKIGKIIELIDDVADQTNLLAVNAAIEAKRAGEQGAGFTVVADEIRKLSDSTTKSTKDITDLIELIQNEISNAIMSMEQSVTSVDEEISLAKDTAESSKEISMSANQQVGAARQIAEAMGSIDEAMKQVAQGAQQSQDAAKQLAELGAELRGSAEKFHVKNV